MWRVTDSPAWADWADSLADRLARGERVGVRAPALPERVLARVHSAAPEAVFLHVPDGPDQIERVVLTLGTALQEAELVDHHLRKTPDDIDTVLGHLNARLGGRPLLVNGWDALDVSSVDWDLGGALRTRTLALRTWLAERSAGLFVGRAYVPRKVHEENVPTEAPLHLVNGGVQDTASLWEELRTNPGLFALNLAARALDASEDDEAVSANTLRTRVRAALPPGVARTLALAALHARPVPRDFFSHFAASTETVDFGRELGLWALVGDELVIAAGWTEYFHRWLSPETRARFHLELAQAFRSQFRPDDLTAADAGISILEAHRHFVEAGDYAQARECWRYGATLLIDAARRRSVARDFGTAAQLYSTVIAAADDGRIALPRQLLAYARHYLHFNRGHGNLESIAATEGGFRDALEDWPENALFWSRLVRVMCYQDKLGTALSDLESAQNAVPWHRQKQTVLIARTVSGLLLRRHVSDAIRVWDDYQPDTELAKDVARELMRALASGWPVTRLTLDENEPPLVFLRPVELRVVSCSGSWSAEASSLDTFETGASPIAAMRALACSIRDDVARLVRAYTSDLSGRDRLRKRLLLGVVDILASRIDAPVPGDYWFFGSLHRAEDGSLWLRTGGDRDLYFEVPGDIVEVVDDLPHLARVAVDERGVPAGPVLELRPGFRGSDSDLWNAWRSLLSDAG